jgi:hypothetical protein
MEGSGKTLQSRIAYFSKKEGKNWVQSDFMGLTKILVQEGGAKEAAEMAQSMKVRLSQHTHAFTFTPFI